jgi:hypothetical protein
MEGFGQVLGQGSMLLIRFALLILAPFLCVGAVGLAFIGMVLFLRWKAQQVKLWRETSGRILEVTVKEILVKRRKRYQAIVRYEYRVNDQLYISNRLFLGNAWRISSRSFAEQRLLRYQPGTTVTVHYNPRQPKEAVLETTIDRALIWTLAGFGGLFLLMSLFLGTVILWSSLATCGISFDATQPQPGSPTWCENWFS